MHAQPLPLHRRIEDALARPGLQAAVRRTTGRLIGSRHAAMAAWPESDAVRDHARAVRAHTIARLDHYLRQFELAVTSRGGHVHWAATAADATGLVVDLIRSRGVRTIVKSKSMVSEEVELNHAIEAAGAEVVETDLGEYVVQLAKDTPSHIIAPIVHKSRADVADLFRRELGATDEDLADVEHMTALARRTLRSAFLRADMGISGGNFGVAETGSLCLVTNEGNGRLTTTLPRIHVALMGIERIVPTMADLGTMLQVLARSATGQTLSVYSNVITGPRRRDGTTGESDGPEELHIVLVDNGRSALLGGGLAEILYCIRCGACLNACPVYQQIGGHAYGSVYPGPVGAVLTPGIRGLEEWHDLPQASSLCGACREVCPVRIDIPRMLLELRDKATREGYAPAWATGGLRIYRALAVRPRWFRVAARVSRALGRLVSRGGWISRLPGPLAGWTRTRDFPAFAPRSFTELWRERGR